jgi:hypothetical protein
MSNLNSFTFDKLKLEFKIIIETYNKINDKRTHLANRIAVLKAKYNDLIHNNNRRIFLFCLDSLHFQYKCLTIELEDIIRFITFINNRMYADYYKLYNLIILQANDKYSLPLPLIDVKKFPVYKDHDPFYEYSIDHIIELHDIIIQIIHTLFVQYSRKEREIYEHNDESNGFSIMNFINTLEYENSLLREQISLQISYVSFFHNLQTNCLDRLLSKIQILHNEVESNLIIKNESKQTVKIDNDIDLNLFFVSPMDNDDLSVEHILTELEHSVNSNEKIMKSVEVVIGASIEASIGASIGASIEETESFTGVTDAVSVTSSRPLNVENIVQENSGFVGATEPSEATEPSGATEPSEATIGLTAPIESKNSNKTQLKGTRIRTTPLANADGGQSIICAISPNQTEDNK